MRIPTLSTPLVTPGDLLLQTVRKLKPLQTVWGLCFRR